MSPEQDRNVWPWSVFGSVHAGTGADTVSTIRCGLVGGSCLFISAALFALVRQRHLQGGTFRLAFASKLVSLSGAQRSLLASFCIDDAMREGGMLRLSSWICLGFATCSMSCPSLR